MTYTTARLPKNHFKCFSCRQLFNQRAGDWFHWDTIQVHLCYGCNQKTKLAPERSASRQVGL
jgi:hypothetical protein